MNVPAVSAQSTLLQKALAAAVVISAFAVPIATTVISGRYADASAKRATSVQLVTLAVGILQEEPKRNAVDIRGWAMDVLDRYSGVPPLSAKARAALADSVKLPGPRAPYWFHLSGPLAGIFGDSVLMYPDTIPLSDSQRRARDSLFDDWLKRSRRPK